MKFIKMRDEELKPCPFCGGRAAVTFSHSERKHRYYLCVTCQECNAKSRSFSSFQNPESIHSDAERLAAMLWNRRTGEEVESNGED